MHQQTPVFNIFTHWYYDTGAGAGKQNWINGD
jgi:hypothetical protein